MIRFEVSLASAPSAADALASGNLSLASIVALRSEVQVCLNPNVSVAILGIGAAVISVAVMRNLVPSILLLDEIELISESANIKLITRFAESKGITTTGVFNRNTLDAFLILIGMNETFALSLPYGEIQQSAPNSAKILSK